MYHRTLFGLKWLCAAGLLWLLFHFVPVHEIVDVLATASGLLVVAGLALQFANRGLATIPLRVITANQGIDLGRGTLFRILLAVQFYALVLPGALAGGGATWLKYLQFGAGKGAAAASVIINRGVGLLVLVPIGSLALAADPRVGPLPPLAASSLIVANLIGLYLFWSPLPRALLPRALLPRALLPRAASRGPWSRLIRRGAERLAVFQQLPARGKAVVLVGSVACELGNAAAMWAFALAVSVPVDYLSVLWMRGVLQLALLLPLSIGGLGIREASLVGLGSLIGVPAADAIAWSLTILAGTAGIALAGGVLELAGGARAATADRVTNPAVITPPGGREQHKPPYAPVD